MRLAIISSMKNKNADQMSPGSQTAAEMEKLQQRLEEIETAGREYQQAMEAL